MKNNFHIFTNLILLSSFFLIQHIYTSQVDLHSSTANIHRNNAELRTFVAQAEILRLIQRIEKECASAAPHNHQNERLEQCIRIHEHRLDRGKTPLLIMRIFSRQKYRQFTREKSDLRASAINYILEAQQNRGSYETDKTETELDKYMTKIRIKDFSTDEAIHAIDCLQALLGSINNKGTSILNNDITTLSSNLKTMHLAFEDAQSNCCWNGSTLNKTLNTHKLYLLSHMFAIECLARRALYDQINQVPGYSSPPPSAPPVTEYNGSGVQDK